MEDKRICFLKHPLFMSEKISYTRIQRIETPEMIDADKEVE